MTSGAPATDHIQDGVYFREGESAPQHLAFVCLNVAPRTKPEALERALTSLLEMLRELRDRGRLRDLAADAGEKDALIPAESFDVLIGYGARFFDTEIHGSPLTSAPRPDFLTRLSASPDAFSSIPRVGSEACGEADVCLQLTGPSQIGVARAGVEVWKLIVDLSLPLEIVETFTGFQRDDRRSWIDFHDGLSNLESSQRLVAIEAGPDPAWNEGGTYLAMLRLQVDLEAWRALSRSEQEVLVGRDKLSGCPIESVVVSDTGLEPQRFSGCQGHGADDPAFLDPPQTGDPLVEASHIHRSNQNRTDPSNPASRRIFRQGYDYFEQVGVGGPEIGLNFISFQSDLERLQQILALSGWFGDVNFGGRINRTANEPEPIVLMRLVAGGFYAVPPRDERLPGSVLISEKA